MKKAIQGIYDPRHIFKFIAYALDHGSVSVENANALMNYVASSSLGRQYLEFAIQTGILYAINPNASTSPLRPTRFGRSLYLRWSENPDEALIELLGSITQYRFHVELLLAELILTNITRNISMDASLTTLASLNRWYLDRLAWIQDEIGWRDAGSFSVNQIPRLRSAIHELNDGGRKILGNVWGKWDNLMGFGTRPYVSDLTKIERLCRFLASSRQQPLRIWADDLNDDPLKSLVLLIIAKEQNYALATQRCEQAVDMLIHLGFDIRHADGSAYLVSAVELILPHIDPPYQTSLEGFSLQKVDDLLAHIYSQVDSNKKQEVVSININDLFQILRSELLDSGLYTISPSADMDDVMTEGKINVWGLPFLTSEVDYDFLEQLIALGNSPGVVSLPLADVFLNREVITCEGDIHFHIRHNPHFTLLLLLLYDVGGATDRLRLQGETWRYDGFDLLVALDRILSDFGFWVWDEGYRYDPEKRSWLGRELVNLACRLGVAQVDGVRLVEKGDGSLAGVYYYKAVNVISRIKKMELSNE